MQICVLWREGVSTGMYRHQLYFSCMFFQHYLNELQFAVLIQAPVFLDVDRSELLKLFANM